MMKIGEVFCLIRNGAAIKQSDGASGIPITRIETISNRIVDRNKFGYANISNASEYQDYLLQDGDILMSHINSEKHLGKTALYHKHSGEQIIHGMNLLLLRPNAEILLADYAMYILNSEMFLRQLPRITKKSVNQASFNISALKELDVYVPSINRQKEIVSVLDKVDVMLERYKIQFKRLDDLIKSRFVEMFGEPSINSMEWPMKPFAETCTLLTGSTPPRAVKEYYGSYIEWIKSDNITTSSLYLTKAAEYLSKEGAKVGRVVHTGAILMTCIAGSLNTVGNVAIVDRDVAFNQQINAFIPQQYETMFLYVLLQLLKPRLHEAASSALKCILNKGNLESYAAIVPDMELQRQFSAFVAEVDKSKLAVKQSLEKLETLKKSLMQQYFG